MAALPTIAQQMSVLAKKDGINPTQLPEIRIMKTSEYHRRKPLLYEKGIIIVGQGAKRVYLGNQVYEYNPDNYLVLTLPIPAECETFATRKTPLLSMFVDIRIEILHQIIQEMGSHQGLKRCEIRNRQPGLFLSRMTPQLRSTLSRLLAALTSPVESGVIGQGLLKEVLFRIMCSESARSLYALAIRNTNVSRVDKALKKIHGGFDHPIQVEELAGLVNMSQSAFHRAFKEVTACSPLQYIKKIRLNKSLDLLMEQKLRVNEAAARVGYESPSQFSREFKRYFGRSPAAYIQIHSPLKAS
ncbi:AraC family transcriptional regulator [Desulfospira joergensenii]|uniref:AraC family transcriptional regulator n=1 Tax=Desulfospira joergensenii TaxID=53329 RepID=UPI0003B4819D|nr:AraC family transcriptional regulator [Desulfospira joergensenii]